MERTARLRLSLVCIGFLAVAAGIGGRLYWIQIHDHVRYQQRAKDQHENKLVIQATRGAIIDRNGEPLATSLRRESLFVHASRVDRAEADRAAKLLAPLLKSSERTLRDKIRSDRAFVFLQRTIEPEVVAKIRELDLPIGKNEAFGFEVEAKRHYPRKELAAHILGYANIDEKGMEGLEYQFHEELKGDATVYVNLVDGKRGEIRRVVRPASRPSQDIQLTIDLVLQHHVESALDHAMKSTGAEAASAVLLDPVRGEILALASRPAPDPNHFGRASEAARFNRAIVGSFEPGSTFKLVPLAALLERDRVRLGEQIQCGNGTFRRSYGRVIRDSHKCGLLTVPEVLAESSNIGMVKLTERLTKQELYDTISAFGFGQKLGLEHPGETAGTFYPLNKWSGASQDSLAFGYEITASITQMAQMFGTIANGGVLVPPRLVRALEDHEGTRQVFARAEPKRVISKQTAAALTDMMGLVVTRGTGKRAQIPGYRVAGKTGTAKIHDSTGYVKRYNASFGGFAPMDDPRVVAYVMLESPNGHWTYGGQVAAPVFAEIVNAALHHLRVPQDADLIPHPQSDTTLQPLPHPRPRANDANIAQGDRMPDVMGLSAREVLSTLSALRLDMNVEGEGYVVRQSPLPGTELTPGTQLKIRLKPMTPDAAVTTQRTSRRRAGGVDPRSAG